METVRRDQMMVVEWADEPYVGKTQAILARTIVAPPLNQLQKGGEVLVKMGKSSSARAWKALFRGTAEELTAMEQSTSEASAGDKEIPKERKRLVSKKRDGKKKSKLENGKKQGATAKTKSKKPTSDAAEDKLDIGAAHSTDDEDEDEDEVFVVEMQKPDWKEPLHEESKARLTMLEEIQNTVNGVSARLANIENLLHTYLYRNPTPYSSSSSESSGFSFSSSMQMYTPGHIPMEPLIPGGEILNHSLQPVTPEVDSIQEEPSTPVMHDLMSTLGVDIFGSSSACQKPHLTSLDSVTSSTSTTSTTTNQLISSQTSRVSTSTTSTPNSEVPTSSSATTDNLIISQAAQISPTSIPVSEAPNSSTTTSTPSVTSQASQQVPNFDSLCQTLGLSPNLVRLLEQGSNSRQNLAANLVRRAYTEKERETSNVNGRKGKKKLDPLRMNMVRKLTYNLKPLKPGENEEEDWKKYCTKAIDSANRKN